MASTPPRPVRLAVARLLTLLAVLAKPPGSVGLWEAPFVPIRTYKPVVSANIAPVAMTIVENRIVIHDELHLRVIEYASVSQKSIGQFLALVG